MQAELTCEEKISSLLFEMLQLRGLFATLRENVKTRAGDTVWRLGERSGLEM